MSFWARLFRRRPSTPIALAKEGPVQLEGRVEVFDPDELLGDPISGDLCVFAHYEAHMPSYAQRLMITGGGGPMNLVAKSAQATEFLLRDESGLALVRPPCGANLLALHRELLSRHGFEMQASTALVRPGDRVRVQGQVLRIMEGSPMRREPYQLTLDAQRVELLG